MNEFKKIFKKVNGFSVIKNYIKARVFNVAIIQILILGTSKKALEILRLSVEFKIQLKLRKKYGYILKEFSKEKNNTLDKKRSNKIWICWLQGIENAPELVKVCYESVCKNLVDWDIIVITSENINEYVELPSYIIEKWNKGIISNTHFSDILRLELLTQHGGLWLDSTILCTGKVPQYIVDSELFIYQCLKPGLDGHSILGSNWLIYSYSNNTILLAVKSLLFNYWKQNDDVLDYFIFHHFMSMTLEYFKDEWSAIPKVPNDLSHILLLQIFDLYDEKKYNDIKQLVPFHKLSYKFSQEDLNKKATFYDIIVNQRKY